MLSAYEGHQRGYLNLFGIEGEMSFVEFACGNMVVLSACHVADDGCGGVGLHH